MFGKDGPSFVELIHQALCSTRKGYDLLAPKFDSTPFRTPNEILAPAIAALGPVGSALDLCCGTGAAMEFLRSQCGERLVGIDFSPGMLEQARIRLAHPPGTLEAEWVEGDVLAMDFHEEFDAATCFGALGHILPRDERKFVQGIYRILKPGGRFLFVTGYAPPVLSLRGAVLRAFNLIMRIRNAVIRPPFIMYYLTFLLPKVEDLLESEGFRVEVRPGLFPMPFDRYCLIIATRS